MQHSFAKMMPLEMFALCKKENPRCKHRGQKIEYQSAGAALRQVAHDPKNEPMSRPADPRPAVRLAKIDVVDDKVVAVDAISTNRLMNRQDTVVLKLIGQSVATRHARAVGENALIAPIGVGTVVLRHVTLQEVALRGFGRFLSLFFCFKKRTLPESDDRFKNNDSLYQKYFLLSRPYHSNKNPAQKRVFVSSALRWRVKIGSCTLLRKNDAPPILEAL
jgi:hypothetical protein